MNDTRDQENTGDVEKVVPGAIILMVRACENDSYLLGIAQTKRAVLVAVTAVISVMVAAALHARNETRVRPR
jgi:hypothetical protein